MPKREYQGRGERAARQKGTVQEVLGNFHEKWIARVRAWGCMLGCLDHKVLVVWPSLAFLPRPTVEKEIFSSDGRSLIGRFWVQNVTLGHWSSCLSWSVPSRPHGSSLLTSSSHGSLYASSCIFFPISSVPRAWSHELFVFISSICYLERGFYPMLCWWYYTYKEKEATDGYGQTRPNPYSQSCFRWSPFGQPFPSSGYGSGIHAFSIPSFYLFFRQWLSTRPRRRMFHHSGRIVVVAGRARNPKRSSALSSIERKSL